MRISVWVFLVLSTAQAAVRRSLVLAGCRSAAARRPHSITLSPCLVRFLPSLTDRNTVAPASARQCARTPTTTTARTSSASACWRRPATIPVQTLKAKSTVSAWPTWTTARTSSEAPEPWATASPFSPWAARRARRPLKGAPRSRRTCAPESTKLLS